MRVLMGFFVDAPNCQLHMNDNAFSVIIPEVSFARCISIRVILAFPLPSTVVDVVPHERSSARYIFPGRCSSVYEATQQIVIFDSYNALG